VADPDRSRAPDTAEPSRPSEARPTEAETLLAVSQAVGSTLQLREVVRRATRALVRALGADTGGAWGLSADRRELVPLAGYHVPPAVLDTLRHSAVDARHPLMEAAARLGGPIYAEDSQADRRFEYPLLQNVPHRSALVQPMRLKGEIVGCFTIVWVTGAHRFTSEELRLVDGIAQQAAIAIDNARLYEEAQRRGREAEVIADIARTINASLDLGTVLQQVAEAARELCGADVAWIALRDPLTGSVIPRYRVGVRSAQDAAVVIEPGKGAGGLVLVTGRPFRTDDYAGDHRITKDYLDVTHDEGVVGEMVVPIRIGEEVEGLLYVDNRAPRPFTDLDESVLSRVAEQAAVAIHNGRLYAEADRRRRAAESLADVGRLVSQSLDPDEVRRRIADSVRLMLGTTRAMLFRLNPVTDTLEVLAVSGDTAPSRRADAGAEAEVVRLAVRDRRPVVTPDFRADPRLTPSPPDRVGREDGDTSQRAVLAAPLLVGSRVIGALSVRDRLGRLFDADDGHLLQAFADQAAIALENARLYAETARLLGEHQQKVDEATRAYDELARTQDQLAQAQKMEAIGRLAGGIAHDFNNLLTVIKGRSQLVLQRLGPDDPLRRQVALIEQTADRAASLTRQLLAFSRKQMLDSRVLDLNVVVEEIENMLRRLIGEHIELRTALAPELGTIRADPGQLEQVILNLIVNARDAMPSGGTLTIETADVELTAAPAEATLDIPAGAYVRLSVSDTGVGMSAGTRAHLFEPFFTTKELGKGTGLGLASVYGIVKQSGGGIAVRSAPGSGSTFTIFLPRVGEPVERVRPGRAEGRAPGGTETILLVEDEDAVRELAREVLQAGGYTVLEARHGQQALEIAEAHQGSIALLLTDVVMPGMDGPSLARHLAAIRPGIRLLYVSGYADRVAEGEDGVPAAALLHKPFSPAVLAAKVREVLDAPP
jgi:signal transduction histidine kinase